MQEDQSPADKPYDPTPRKLEEARKKGEIVRSSDLNTAITYAGFLLAGALVVPWAALKLGNMSEVLWGQADQLAPLVLGSGGQSLAAGIIGPASLALLVIAAVPALLLLVALFAQQAILFTPSKLAPKLNRIGMISNAKQKYGSQGLFQFAKSAVKLAIIGALLAAYLIARADPILMSLYATPGQTLVALGRLSFEFMAVVTAVAMGIAVVDWLWEWSQHQNKNRMTRQELMDETKSSEGDPHMKQQRRQKGQALAMNRMLTDVPSADVVVVNPTHYAVALKWDRGAGEVPVVVAKGVDEIAARIREVAAESAIPIFSDPPTARALHAVLEVGDPILPDQFKAVAAAIRFADLMRAKAGRRPKA
ncbi:MAG: flagellar type III secretion system protein FlhB [Pseudomonadota bacterium]